MPVFKFKIKYKILYNKNDDLKKLKNRFSNHHFLKYRMTNHYFD